MKIYEIINGEKCYWTENKEIKLGFWSPFKPLLNDKREFFIIKTLFLFFMMKLNGNKPILEIKKIKGDVGK